MAWFHRVAMRKLRSSTKILVDVIFIKFIFAIFTANDSQPVIVSFFIIIIIVIIMEVGMPHAHIHLGSATMHITNTHF